MVTARVIQNFERRYQRRQPAKGRRALRLLAFARKDLAPAVIAVGADVVSAMGFARGRLDGKRRGFQRVVRAAHAALGRGFPILLNCHVAASNGSNLLAFQRRQRCEWIRFELFASLS